MTEKEKERERKKKEEGYRFPTLRVKTEWTYIYILASIIKKEKKSLKILSYQEPYLLTFFFSLTPPVFFFFSIFFGIGSCMYAYLTLLKVCAYL